MSDPVDKLRSRTYGEQGQERVTVSEPGPGEPDYWPEHPPAAIWSNGGFLNSRRGWAVEGTPPAPWPNFEGQPPRSVFGPPGTKWRYLSDDLLDRLHVSWSDLATEVVQVALKFLKRRFLAPATVYTWEVPGVREGELMTTTVVRTSIHARLQGAEEELVHVLNWSPLDAAAVDVVEFATFVRDQWTAALTSFSGLLYTATNYDYVAAAVIKLDPPDDPEYLVNTEYVNFTTATHGTGALALPNEVAMCVSHVTERRGARFRGRTYLGGLAAGALLNNGRFDPTFQTAARNGFIAFVNGVSINTGAQFVVASGKFGTAEKVVGERVGDVPDSMRSRRKQQTEVYSSAPLVP